MPGPWSAIPDRINGDDILASWFNDIKNAGLALQGWSPVYTFDYTDFSIASNNRSIDLATISAKQVVHGVFMKHSLSFQGGAISGYTLTVGVSGTPSRFSGLFDVFQAAGDGVFYGNSIVDMPSYSSTTDIKIQATSTGAQLDQATQGAVEVWLLLSTLTS